MWFVGVVMVWCGGCLFVDCCLWLFVGVLVGGGGGWVVGGGGGGGGGGVLGRVL